MSTHDHTHRNTHSGDHVLNLRETALLASALFALAAAILSVFTAI